MEIINKFHHTTSNFHLLPKEWWRSKSKYSSGKEEYDIVKAAKMRNHALLEHEIKTLEDYKGKWPKDAFGLIEVMIMAGESWGKLRHWKDMGVGLDPTHLSKWLEQKRLQKRQLANVNLSHWLAAAKEVGFDPWMDVEGKRVYGEVARKYTEVAPSQEPKTAQKMNEIMLGAATSVDELFELAQGNVAMVAHALGRETFELAAATKHDMKENQRWVLAALESGWPSVTLRWLESGAARPERLELLEKITTHAIVKRKSSNDVGAFLKLLPEASKSMSAEEKKAWVAMFFHARKGTAAVKAGLILDIQPEEEWLGVPLFTLGVTRGREGQQNWLKALVAVQIKSEVIRGWLERANTATAEHWAEFIRHGAANLKVQEAENFVLAAVRCGIPDTMDAEWPKTQKTATWNMLLSAREDVRSCVERVLLKVAAEKALKDVPKQKAHGKQLKPL
jgi:hypothetical protein